MNYLLKYLLLIHSKHSIHSIHFFLWAREESALTSFFRSPADPSKNLPPWRLQRHALTRYSIHSSHTIHSIHSFRRGPGRNLLLRVPSGNLPPWRLQRHALTNSFGTPIFPWAREESNLPPRAYKARALTD